MIGKLNHVAIAVPDLAAASASYRDTLGAKVSEPLDLPFSHGVTTIFVELENTKLELLHPLGDESPIAKFLERNPGGGIHHICYEVADIYAPEINWKVTECACWGTGSQVLALMTSRYCFFIRRISTAR